MKVSSEQKLQTFNINAVPLTINQKDLRFLEDFFLINGPNGFENYSFYYIYNLALQAYGFEAGVKFLNYYMRALINHTPIAQPMIIKYDQQKKDWFIYVHPNKALQYQWSRDIVFQQYIHAGHVERQLNKSYNSILTYIMEEYNKRKKSKFYSIEHEFLSREMKNTGWFRALLVPLGDPKDKCFALLTSLIKINFHIDIKILNRPISKQPQSFPKLWITPTGKALPYTTTSWYDQLLKSILYGMKMMKQQPVVQIHSTYGLSLFLKTLLQSFGVKKTIEILKREPDLYTDRHGNGMWLYKQISEYPQKDEWIPQFYTYSPNDNRVGKRVSTQQPFLDESCGEQRCNYLNVQSIIRDNARKGIITVVPWIDRTTKKPILFFDLGQQYIEDNNIYHYGSGLTWRILS